VEKVHVVVKVRDVEGKEHVVVKVRDVEGKAHGAGEHDEKELLEGWAPARDHRAIIV
jgi:hypothetical protein